MLPCGFEIKKYIYIIFLCHVLNVTSQSEDTFIYTQVRDVKCAQVIKGWCMHHMYSNLQEPNQLWYIFNLADLYTSVTNLLDDPLPFEVSFIHVQILKSNFSRLFFLLFDSSNQHA